MKKDRKETEKKRQERKGKYFPEDTRELFLM